MNLPRARHAFTSPRGFRYAHTRDLFALMGHPNAAKWPDAGLPARAVQGIWVWVLPRNPPEPGARKSSRHRVRCLCPSCGREVSAGRLSQHTC